MAPRVQATKAKLDKWGLYQAKKLLHSKGNNQQNSQPMEWEKIFVNYIFHKGLISKIYK